MIVSLLLAASISYRSPPPWKQPSLAEHQFSSWKAGDTLFAVVEDANVRDAAAIDAKAATVPLGTRFEILKVASEPVQVGDRVDRWYEVRSESPSVKGFVFGSVLTPFMVEGDVDGDGENEVVSAGFTSGLFARVRVWEPSVKGKKVVASFDLDPLPFKGALGGELKSLKLVEGKRPVLAVELCEAKCRLTVLEYRAATKKKVGTLAPVAQLSLGPAHAVRLDGEQLFAGPADARPELAMAGGKLVAKLFKGRWVPVWCEGCAAGPLPEPKGKKLFTLQLTLPEEPRIGYAADVPCFEVSGLGGKLADCMVHLTGKTEPDEWQDHWYSVEGEVWTQLGGEVNQEVNGLLQRKGKKVTVNPAGVAPFSAAVAGLTRVAHFLEAPSGALEPALFVDGLGLLKSSTRQIRPLRGSTTPGELTQGQGLVAAHPAGGALVLSHQRSLDSKKLSWGAASPGEASWSSVLQSDCGPAFWEDVAIDSLRGEDLEPVAIDGESLVFGLRDPQHPLLKQLQRELPTLAGKYPTPQAFAASRPLLFVRDPFSRWLELTRGDAQIPQICEPIIYLYPKAPLEVTVTLGSGLDVFASVPPATSNAWRVRASPDGTLVSAQGGTHHRLFWEGRGPEFASPHGGWSVPRAQTRAFLQRVLPQLGLEGHEVREFIASWARELERAEHNLISFHAAEEIARVAPLSVSPLPDTVIRVLMEYQPGAAPFTVDAPGLPPPPAREGFTVVEWGGVKRRR